MLAKMGQTNVSDAQVAEMLVAMGAVVTLEQFKQVYYKQQGDRAPAPGSPEEAALLRAFKDFDTDGSNTITADEMHAMLQKLGHASTKVQVAEMLVAMGAQVSFDAFAGVYTKHHQQQQQQQQKKMQAAATKPGRQPAIDKALCDAFNEFDADHSGTISASDVKSMLAKMGQTNISDAQVAEMLVAMGAVVTLEQFKQVCYAQQGAPAQGSIEEAALLQAFKDCDTDGSGTITADEMRDVLQKLGQAASDAQVAEMLVAMGAQVSCGAFADVYTKQLGQEQRQQMQGQQQMQQAATNVNSDPAVEKTLRNAFNEFDKDRSGTISASEVKSMLAKMGQANISDAQLAEMLVAMGAVVTLEQFKQVYYMQQGGHAPAPGSPAEAALLQAFKDFDTDGSNTITADELHAMLQKLGHAATKVQVAEMLVAMGAQVSFDAFANAYAKQQLQAAATKPGRDPAIEKALRNAFNEFDKDRSEMLVAMGAVVTLEQFKQVYYMQQGGHAPAPGSRDDVALLQAFKDFDTDGSNMITADEMHAMLQRLGQAVSKVQVAEMLVAMGAQVSFDAFADMYTKQQQPQQPQTTNQTSNALPKPRMSRPLNMDPATEAALRQTFNEFDADRSGSISASEIKRMLAKMGQANISDAQVAEMLVAMGAVVTLEQFTEVYQRQAGGGPLKPGSREEDALMKAYRKFDADLSGTITASEMKAVMAEMGQALSDAQVAEMLVSMGAQVTFESFAEVYANQPPAPSPAAAGAAAGGVHSGARADDAVRRSMEPGDDTVLSATMPADGDGMPSLPPSLMGTHASIIMPELSEGTISGVLQDGSIRVNQPQATGKSSSDGASKPGAAAATAHPRDRAPAADPGPVPLPKPVQPTVSTPFPADHAPL
eukprot:364939-Chlamydomonas_euryale.AAC.12